jgi:hypothetical protein
VHLADRLVEAAERPRIAALERHHVDRLLVVGAARRHERERVAARRERGTAIALRIAREPPHRIATDVGQVEIVVRGALGRVGAATTNASLLASGDHAISP